MMLAGKPTTAFLTVIEAALSAAIAAATLKKVYLFTDDPAGFGVNTLTADLHEPVYPGYARQNIVAGSLRSDSNKDVITPYGTQTFQPNADPVAPVTVTGYAIVLDGVLWWTEALPATFTFATATDALDVLIDQYVRNATVYGGLCATCPALV